MYVFRPISKANHRVRRFTQIRQNHDRFAKRLAPRLESGHDSVQRGRAMTIQALYSAHIVLRTSRSKPMRIGLPCPQTVMLHRNNPAQSIQKFLCHHSNPNRVITIGPNPSRLGHREKRRFQAWKSNDLYRKMPRICGIPGDPRRKNSKLSGHIGGKSVIKKQVARIFDKNSHCHRFSS